MKKAIIKAANVCNNNCLFCHFKDNHDHIELSFQKIYRKILQIKPKADMILLSGGEITIDKNFLKIIDFIYNQELAIGLITNARMLSNQKLCNHLHKKGLKYVYTSLHGPDKELHNKLTQSESFEQTLLGIRNILRFSDIECIVNIVVNKMNMLRLREIIDLAVGKNIPIIKFSNVFIKGTAKNNMKIIPKISESWRHVKDAVDYGCSKGIDMRIDCFPNCIIKGYEKKRDNLQTNNILWMSEMNEDYFYQTDEGERKHYDCCLNCSEKNNCSGIYERYADAFGIDEFTPMIHPIANSFNYFKIDESDNFEWQEQTSKYPNCRDICLINDNGCKIFHTGTKDFNDTTIKKIKDLQQIYINISPEKRSDDFSKSYRKLVLSENQENCYNILHEDIFARDDKILLNILADINGNVLDIGCNDLKYTDLIREKIKKEAIRYEGIDPDELAIKKAKQKLPSVNFECISFEEFNSDKKYDYVLLLRSLNHFRDVPAVIRKCTSILKDGGKLIICDNAPFGVVQQEIEEEKGCETESREHYHNLFSDDLAQIVKREPFKMILQKKIDEKSSNQWLMVLEKI